MWPHIFNLSLFFFVFIYIPKEYSVRLNIVRIYYSLLLTVELLSIIIIVIRDTTITTIIFINIVIVYSSMFLCHVFIVTPINIFILL